ncbi:hypothetical protein LCGC14_1742650 [marine sediment metagenome]|uniref:Uncharacterized protein n=1 Tax=marine sediment metagenome TaxID=412755 RepID=A0A0F9K5W1_9ZZZZ
MVELVLTILSAFLANQFYYKEYYHFKEIENNYKIQKARLIPFPTRAIQKFSHYSLFTAPGLQRHFGEIYAKISIHSLADSLFYLMATLVASLRENIFETSSILAWNFLEHLASRYWKIEDQNFLLTIKQEKFEQYISKLKDFALNFIKNEIKKEDVLLTGEASKIYETKNILTSGISSSIFRYSPVKYRIFSMFEKEGILEDEDKDKVKKMNKIRNLIMHDGLSLQDIRATSKIDFDPVEFNVQYKAFLYRKFLMFLKIIPDHAQFQYGKLILKENNIEEQKLELKLKENGEPAKKIIMSTLKLSAEKGRAEINFEKAKILENLNSLRLFEDLKLKVNMKWTSHEEDVEIVVNYRLDKDKGKYILQLNNPSNEYIRYCYSSQFRVTTNNPEDNLRLVQPTIFRSNYKEYQVKIIVYGKPIKYNIHDWRVLGFTQVEEEGEFVILEIDELFIELP